MGAYYKKVDILKNYIFTHKTVVDPRDFKEIYVRHKDDEKEKEVRVWSARNSMEFHAVYQFLEALGAIIKH